jgi:hypothetical protein
MKKRVLSMVLASVVLMAVLSACSGGNLDGTYTQTGDNVRAGIYSFTLSGDNIYYIFITGDTSNINDDDAQRTGTFRIAKEREDDKDKSLLVTTYYGSDIYSENNMGYVKVKSNSITLNGIEYKKEK